MKEYVDKAVYKCLQDEYWGYEIIKIYDYDQIFTKYKYGIFTKPKLHFREKLWEVNINSLSWKQINLNGTWYYRDQILKDNRSVWVAKDIEHKIAFYR